MCYCVQQGGTTPMMGQQSRAEWLFYYFHFGRADPQRSFTANNRPLRRLRFVPEELKDFCSPRADPRSILKFHCDCCWSAISTASPANGVKWKRCACIWLIVGSRVSVLRPSVPTEGNCHRKFSFSMLYACEPCTRSERIWIFRITA